MNFPLIKRIGHNRGGFGWRVSHIKEWGEGEEGEEGKEGEQGEVKPRYEALIY
jgi:hypothetical protein